MSLIDQLSRWACETVRLADGASVQFRRAPAGGTAGAAATQVLLHGIGSASGSWLAQLQQARSSAHPASQLLAWDAPGYGASTALPMQAPQASDYARRMWAWLDALGLTHPVTLVGHSLGALIAAAAALQAPPRVERLVLLAPAQGYGRSDAGLRERKLHERLGNLAALGPAGVARQRAPALLSVDADATQIAFVEHVMAQIDPAGYTQAARMLAGGDLITDLRRVPCPVTIGNGEADTITPPLAARELALAVGARYVSLGPVGHGCPLQAAARVNRLLGLQQEAA